MNQLIASELKDRILSTITWADRVVGLVKPLTYTTGSDEKIIKHTIPISCDIEEDQKDCISKKEHHVIPDNKLKALIYFEDGGSAPTGRSSRGWTFTSTITLVCWMNLQKLGQTSCTASAFAMTQLIESLNSYKENVTPINTIWVEEISIGPKSPQIFSRYTYDQTQVQYLMYPYDYFSLQLKVSFEIPIGCIDDSWVENPTACITN